MFMHHHPILTAALLSRTAALLGLPVPVDADPNHPGLDAARIALEAYAPRDVHEADQAVEAIALRSVFLDACRRVLDPELPPVLVHRLHRSIASLSRSLTASVAILERRRAAPSPAPLDQQDPLHQPAHTADAAWRPAAEIAPGSQDPMHQEPGGIAHSLVRHSPSPVPGNQPPHMPAATADRQESMHRQSAGIGIGSAPAPRSPKPVRAHRMTQADPAAADSHDLMHQQPARVGQTAVARPIKTARGHRVPAADTAATDSRHDPMHQHEQHYDALARFASRRLSADQSPHEAWVRASADADEASVELRLIEIPSPAKPAR
jgi:hypothetical protein